MRVTTDGAMGSAAIHLGIEQGFFAEQGLELDLSDSPNPPAAVAALQRGEVNIAAVPLVPSINAQSQGIDLVSIASVSGHRIDSAHWEGYDEAGIFVQPDSGMSSPR